MNLFNKKSTEKKFNEINKTTLDCLDMMKIRGGDENDEGGITIK